MSVIDDLHDDRADDHSARYISICPSIYDDDNCLGFVVQIRLMAGGWAANTLNVTGRCTY